MGIYAFKPAFRRSLEPIARRLAGVHPDAVSYAAVAFALAAGVMLAFAPRAPWLYLAAPPLFLARLACNALDGMIAQSSGEASARGEVVNELSDRVSDTLILGGVALGGVAHPLLAGGALVATLLVSYVGILSKAVGARRNYDGPLGKPDRMALLALGCFAAFAAHAVATPFAPAQALDATMIAFVALGLLTLARRTLAAWREAGGARA